MTNDPSCIAFLQWSLPQRQYLWKGFRKVRRQVCRRVRRRFTELGLPDFLSYRQYLDAHQDEWDILDSLCSITISRFYRDRRVFEIVESNVFPRLIDSMMSKKESELRCWSAGCCSGEEPYTMQIVWTFRVSPQYDNKMSLRIVATDREQRLIQRARDGVYPRGSLKELPRDLFSQSFDDEDEKCRLKVPLKNGVTFLAQDIRERMPEGKFHLILCRNLVFTYFVKALQTQILTKLVAKLEPGGFLIIGAHESLPVAIEDIVPYQNHTSIYQKPQS